MGWEWHKITRPRLGIVLILVAFVVLGVLYSVTTPIFESPDEIQHFFYAKHLSDGNGLPVQSTGHDGLWAQEGSQPPLYYGLVALLIAPLDTSNAPALVWENEHANLGNPLRLGNKDRVVHTGQETWPYRKAVLAVHLARWLSVLMGAGTVWLVYLVAAELLPGQPALALAAAGLTAFTPQFVFISSTVSNDNLIILLTTLAVWVLLRGLNGAPSRAQIVGLGLVLGLAALTKLSGLMLWVFVGATLLGAGIRRRAWRRTAGDLITVFAIALAVAGWWYWRNWRLYGDFTGLNRMLDVVGRRESPLGWRDLLAQFQGLRVSYWALFGWFNLPLPGWVYRALDGFTVVALLGFPLTWLRHPRDFGWANLRRALWLLAWIGLMLVSLARWTMLTPGTQGRLLYPAAWAINLVLIWGWSRWVITPRWRKIWLAVPVVPLAILTILAPFTVIRPAFAKPPLITPAAIPVETRLSPVRHGEQVRRLGATIKPTTAHPGDTVWVTLYWQVLARLDQDYTVFVHLTDHQGRSVAEANSWPGLGNYPTRLWQPGTVIVDRYPVQIPGAAATPTLLRADVGFFIWPEGDELPSYAADGKPAPDVVGILRLLPRHSRQPHPSTPLDIKLGDGVMLLGYDLAPSGPLAPGQTLTLTLYWRATARLTEDYTVFVHLRGPDGAALARWDGQPLDGAWPTSAWEPGQPVTDSRILTLPADVAPGRYTLWVGMYRLADGARLRVAGPVERVRDDAIRLGDVVVSGE